MTTHRFRCGAVAKWKNVQDNPLPLSRLVNCSKCIRQYPDAPDHWCPAQDSEYVLRDKHGAIVERRKR